MHPATADRVRNHTSVEINRRIDSRLKSRLQQAAARPELIDRQLAELDREWNIERALAANAATLVLAGVGLGTMVDRRYLLLPATVAGFLLHHALRGWCPPVPLLRRLGFRTAAEIDHERYALKAMRGDFEAVRRDASPTRLVRAAITAAVPAAAEPATIEAVR